MGNTQNEQGYALVTVMIIVTVFTILFLAFMGQAFNSVKQNQTVEKTSQSVALAEMGVSYYDVAIQNIFEQIKAEVTEKVGNKTFLVESDVVEYIKTELKRRIRDISPTSDSIDQEANFILEKNSSDQNDTDEPTDKIRVTRTGNQLKINVTIVGLKKDTRTNLDVEMVINNLADIKIVKSAPSNPPEISFDKVKKPDISNVNCNNPISFKDLNREKGNSGDGKNGNSDLNYTCPDVYIDKANMPNGTRSYSENNSIEVSKIYSTIDLVFTGNLNNTGSIDIYAQSLEIGQNFNNPSSVTVETKKNLTIGSNINGNNVNKLNFYVGGLFFSEGQINLKGSSHILIRGNRTEAEINNKIVSKITKELDIDSTSAVCVNGDIKVSSINNNGQFFIKGTILKLDGTPFDTNTMRNKPIIVNESNQNKTFVQQQCLTTFDTPTSNSIEWGNLSNSMINDVVYP